MKPRSSIPNIVLEAGLPARFRYWSGGSGRRYLFTKSDLEAVCHFDNAVIIVVRYGRIVWAGGLSGSQGEYAGLNEMSDRDGAQIFVHLLARDDTQRSQIIEDLEQAIEIDQIDIQPTARILEFPTAA